jgi:hypothetical protein
LKSNQIKKLLAIGDSFTYGSELKDFSMALPSVVSWPYILGNQLGYNVVNRGVVGSGNIKMVRTLVEENINEYDLVIIAWSGFDRIELADEYSVWGTHVGANKSNYRITEPAVEFRGTIIDYFNRHHNDDYLYRQQYLVQIILAQNYLKCHKKNYVMLDAFLNHTFLGRADPKNKDLIDQIDTTHFLGWPNESMLEWTAKVPYGPGKHFLEEGHQIVAKKIFKHLDIAV